MEHDPLLDPLKTSADERYFELAKRRKAFAARSDDVWIEQPRLLKPNAPQQDARKDTVLSQPSPKTRPTESSEDEVEF